MGSKRSMLLNGLGEIINSSAPKAAGFADLFTGSGTVARHVAERFHLPVFAGDLQHFAVALADSVIGRTAPAQSYDWLDTWFSDARAFAETSEIWPAAISLQANLDSDDIAVVAEKSRELCHGHSRPLCRAYGGWYYSPAQILVLDGLRATLPSEPSLSKVALGALISAASTCAAAPGHTAQPFKANSTAGPFLREAWRKAPIAATERNAREIGKRFALSLGESSVADAETQSKKLSEGWLAFLDPPYSSVHYSRFYHVLESLSRGTIGEVSGTGRYPAPIERPASDFSVPTKAANAFSRLLGELALVGADAIITFPADGASTGISGDQLRELSSTHYNIVEEKVSSRMSTLGGNRTHRAARQNTVELILKLSPR
jgi:adenine-specific DNA-methyltransferase